MCLMLENAEIFPYNILFCSEYKSEPPSREKKIQVYPDDDDS